MNLFSRKTYALCLVICFLITSILPAGVLAAETDSVSVNEETGMVTITGSIEEYTVRMGEAYVIIPNEGKTYDDFAASQTAEDLLESTLYIGLVPVSRSGSYDYSFSAPGIRSDSPVYLAYNGKVENINKQPLAAETLYIFVDVENGSDSNNGLSKDSALKTVEAAQEIYKTHAETRSAEIILCSGTYPAITADVNPGEGYTLTYKSAPGEQAVISGMTKLNTSDFKLVSDLSVRDKFKEEARLNIYELDLAEYGITSDDILGNPNGFYGARDLAMAQLYLNGKPQQISRWPNSGYSGLTFTSEGTDAETSKSLYSFTHEDALRWHSSYDGIYLEGFFDYYGVFCYCRSYADFKSVSDGKFTFFKPSISNVDSGKVAVCNLMEETDVPGEWCVDASALKLYYYMPDNLTENDTIEIALSDTSLITLPTGASDITIDGLKVTGSRGNLVTLTSADRVAIRNCTLENGRYGIVMSGRNNIVENNSIRYTKGTAIWLKSGAAATDETLTESANVISNNHIYACATCGIQDGKENSTITVRLGPSVNTHSTTKISLVGDIVKNNVIHANPYGQAIVYFGMDLKIRGNEFYNMQRYTSDSGVIYTGAKLNQYGTVIENNYIHDFSHLLSDSAPSSTSAIYWDDWHSGQTALNNIIVSDGNADTRGLLSVGMRNTAQDNIVVNAGKGMIASTRGTGSPFTKDNFTKGVYKTLDTDNLPATVTQRHPEILESKTAIAALVNGEGSSYFPYSENTITGNFHVNVPNTTSSGSGTIRDNISITSDNLSDIFVNPAEHDWRIKEDVASAYGVSDLLADFSMDSIGLQSDIPATSGADRGFRLYTPAVYDTEDGKEIVLSWEKALFADRYVYEVATDSTFTVSSIVASGTTMDSCAEITGLKGVEGYFWRVTAVNDSKSLGAEYTADGGYGSFSLNDSELKVSDVVFYDSTNTRITNLADITDVDYMDCTITNDASYPISYEIIVVIRDPEKGSVKHVMTQNETGSATAGKRNYRIGLIPPEQYAAGDEICIFLWDDLGTLRPLSKKKLIK